MTVEKVAANAVLAGCTPESFNVVLASVEAVLAEPFNLHGLHATTSKRILFFILSIRSS